MKTPTLIALLLIVGCGTKEEAKESVGEQEVTQQEVTQQEVTQQEVTQQEVTQPERLRTPVLAMKASDEEQRKVVKEVKRFLPAPMYQQSPMPSPLDGIEGCPEPPDPKVPFPQLGGVSGPDWYDLCQLSDGVAYEESTKSWIVLEVFQDEGGPGDFSILRLNSEGRKTLYASKDSITPKAIRKARRVLKKLSLTSVTNEVVGFGDSLTFSLDEYQPLVRLNGGPFKGHLLYLQPTNVRKSTVRVWLLNSDGEHPMLVKELPADVHNTEGPFEEYCRDIDDKTKIKECIAEHKRLNKKEILPMYPSKVATRDNLVVITGGIVAPGHGGYPSFSTAFLLPDELPAGGRKLTPKKYVRKKAKFELLHMTAARKNAAIRKVSELLPTTPQDVAKDIPTPIFTLRKGCSRPDDNGWKSKDWPQPEHLAWAKSCKVQSSAIYDQDARGWLVLLPHWDPNPIKSGFYLQQMYSNRYSTLQSGVVYPSTIAAAAKISPMKNGVKQKNLIVESSRQDYSFKASPLRHKDYAPLVRLKGNGFDGQLLFLEAPTIQDLPLRVWLLDKEGSNPVLLGRPRARFFKQAGVKDSLRCGWRFGKNHCVLPIGITHVAREENSLLIMGSEQVPFSANRDTPPFSAAYTLPARLPH